MILRVQNFMLVALFALLSLFWVQSVVTSKPMSGGYQNFWQAAFANIADNPLNAIEKFSASLENAPECCNAHGFTSDGYVRYDTDGDGVWDTPCEIAFNFWDFNWLLGSAAYACPDGTKPTSSNDNPPATNGGVTQIDTPIDLKNGRSGHILANHRAGADKAGKTEFPSSWDDQRIIHQVSDISTDPALVRQVDSRGTPYVVGTRDGVEIRVNFFPDNHARAGQIATAYPTQ